MNDIHNSKSKKIAKEISDLIDLYVKDPSDQNLESLYLYFKEVYGILESIRKRRKEEKLQNRIVENGNPTKD